MAHHYSGTKVASPFLHLKKYAWGGERITVSKFTVNTALFDHHPFTLTALRKNRFALYSPDGEFILKGRIGTLTRSKKFPQTSILVSQMHARPQQQFTVRLIPNRTIINQLKSAITTSDAGNNSNHSVDTGILNISLTWPDKTKAPIILNNILNIIKQKNIEQKTQTAQQALKFVQQQIPRIKNDLNSLQAKLNTYKAKEGIINIPAQALNVLSLKNTLIKKETQLKLLKEKLSHYFQPNHPAIKNLQIDLNTTKNQLKKINRTIQKTPQLDQEAVSLTRDLKVEDTLYSKLINQVQQLQIYKAGTIGDVRILNQATIPLTALPTHHKSISIGGGILAFILCSIILIMKEQLFSGVQNPQQLEQMLGISLHAVIPFSQAQHALSKQETDHLKVLSLKQSKDVAIEGLRSLRTTLSLELLDSPNKIINIMGASPAIGKSFITLNLAHVFAEAGKKVLLICADMRKGKLHISLNIKQEPGLSDYLKDSVCLDEIIHHTPHIDFISCGKYPENPAELLLKSEFKGLLKSVESQYDVILLDTPPILAVTDASIIGQNEGINLMAVGLGQNKIEELRATLNRLENNKIKLHGLVCNYYKKKSNSYDYNSYYNYTYK